MRLNICVPKAGAYKSHPLLTQSWIKAIVSFPYMSILLFVVTQPMACEPQQHQRSNSKQIEDIAIYQLRAKT